MSQILDISRFVSRAHLPFDTGIDRVERAFILDTLGRFQNPHFLARVGKYFAILDSVGMQGFLAFERDQNWPRQHGIDVLRLKLTNSQRRVRSALRLLSRGYCKLNQLAKMIAEVGINEFGYTNAGHSNLSPSFLCTLRAAGASNISVFIHDVIPLDYPQFCRPDRLKPFAQKMRNVMDHSDQIYCNSHYTFDRISAHFDNAPPMRVTYLASMARRQKVSGQSNGFDNPTFGMLGTIEPRKNLTFILNVWDILGATLPKEKMPTLLIMGKRGWEDPRVFERLSNAKHVVEKNELNDEEVQNDLMKCLALLFPSHVEGYGLPAQEAIDLGVPVLASNIPVFRELFSDSATLLSIDDPQIWADHIRRLLLNVKKVHTNTNYYAKTVTWDNFFSDLYSNSDRE
jgi:glycosyltransferase involved in cell wall biosynthesis